MVANDMDETPDTGGPQERAEPLSGLAFLVGRWRGVGEWGGEPFDCRTEIMWLFERHLQIDVAATQEGRAAHSERVLIHLDGHDGGDNDGHAGGQRIAATLYPQRGSVQRFEVHELEHGSAYRLLFTPPAASGLSPQRWTIRRTDAGYEELFEIAPGGGAFQPSVMCSYEPDTRALDDEASARSGGGADA